jgi:hypothetical protein
MLYLTEKLVYTLEKPKKQRKSRAKPKLTPIIEEPELLEEETEPEPEPEQKEPDDDFLSELNNTNYESNEVVEEPIIGYQEPIRVLQSPCFCSFFS